LRVQDAEFMSHETWFDTVCETNGEKKACVFLEQNQLKAFFHPGEFRGCVYLRSLSTVYLQFIYGLSTVFCDSGMASHWPAGKSNQPQTPKGIMWTYSGQKAKTMQINGKSVEKRKRDLKPFPWLPRDFALSANQRRALPMKKSWPSKMRKKTACFGWYGSCFDLVRSTKIEAPLIGLWPKSFSVTVMRRLGLKSDVSFANSDRVDGFQVRG
jgi:hypothetical protein